MPQILYSCKEEIDREDIQSYRITKFVDGEVESSYTTTQLECACPAGVRPSCRHRQMLPMMIASGIVNTHWFWDFDLGRAVDFQGELKSNVDALNELAASKPKVVYENKTTHTEADLLNKRKVVPADSWRRM